MPKTTPAIEAIRELLRREDVRGNYAVEEAVLRIYDRQTDDEQELQSTKHANGRGFSAFDAEILSSFAVQIRANRYGRPNGQRLSAKQMTIARKKIVYYARQLAEIAEQKQAARQLQTA
jgi:hypothetical protein